MLQSSIPSVRAVWPCCFLSDHLGSYIVFDRLLFVKLFDRAEPSSHSTVGHTHGIPSTTIFFRKGENRGGEPRIVELSMVLLAMQANSQGGTQLDGCATCAKALTANRGLG